MKLVRAMGKSRPTRRLAALAGGLSVPALLLLAWMVPVGEWIDVVVIQLPMVLFPATRVLAVEHEARFPSWIRLQLRTGMLRFAGYAVIVLLLVTRRWMPAGFEVSTFAFLVLLTVTLLSGLAVTRSNGTNLALGAAPRLLALLGVLGGLAWTVLVGLEIFAGELGRVFRDTLGPVVAVLLVWHSLWFGVRLLIEQKMGLEASV